MGASDLRGTEAEAAAEFTALMQQHRAFMLRYARKLTRDPDDADDLVQDVMLKLYMTLDQLRGVAALRPWIARVMQYHYIDQLRRRPRPSAFVSLDRVRRASGSEDEGDAELHWALVDERPGPEAQVQMEEQSAHMACAVQRLPAALREAVILHENLGLSLPAVSARTGVSVNTLKSGLKRARCSLRRSLAGADAEPQRLAA